MYDVRTMPEQEPKGGPGVGFGVIFLVATIIGIIAVIEDGGGAMLLCAPMIIAGLYFAACGLWPRSNVTRKRGGDRP
jgi:hypothetical protein